jgi:hypothetical protein
MKYSIDKPKIEFISKIPERPNAYKNFYPEMNGKNVNICVVGSGLPSHKDISNVLDFEVFIEKEPEDHFGLSTYSSGIFCRNNKNGLTGIASESNMYFTKRIKNNGEVIESSVIASLLWASIKKCDIIFIPFPINKIIKDIKEVLDKIIKEDIILITSDKNNIDNAITIPNNITCKGFITTYSGDQYIKANGDSILSGITCGLVARILQKEKLPVKDIMSKLYG